MNDIQNFVFINYCCSKVEFSLTAYGCISHQFSDIKFNTGSQIPPESVCSSPCSVGQPKKYVEGERCCWHCFNCSQYQVFVTISIYSEDEFTLKK